MDRTVSEQTTVTPLIVELLCGTVVAAGYYIVASLISSASTCEC